MLRISLQSCKASLKNYQSSENPQQKENKCIKLSPKRKKKKEEHKPTTYLYTFKYSQRSLKGKKWTWHLTFESGPPGNRYIFSTIPVKILRRKQTFPDTWSHFHSSDICQYAILIFHVHKVLPILFSSGVPWKRLTKCFSHCRKVLRKSHKSLLPLYLFPLAPVIKFTRVISSKIVKTLETSHDEDIKKETKRDKFTINH